MLQVQPDVESRLRWYSNLEAKTLKPLEDMVTLVLEVPLQSDLLVVDVIRVQQRDSRELQTGRDVRENPISELTVRTDGSHRRRGRNQIATAQ